LVPARRLAGTSPRLAGAHDELLGDLAQSAPAFRRLGPLRRLCDRRFAIGVQAADVERHGRLDRQLGGAFPAPASLGLPPAYARWHRRGLALLLFRPRAVLRPE